MLTRISRRTGNNNGLNQTREEVARRFNLIESREPYNINDNLRSPNYQSPTYDWDAT